MIIGKINPIYWHRIFLARQPARLPLYTLATTPTASSSSPWRNFVFGMVKRTMTTTTTMIPNHNQKSETNMTMTKEGCKGEFAGWKGNLLQASNWASILCVVDCTVLPVVTIVLPFLGLVVASPAQMEWLHQLGHSVALWFVMPVGGSATLLNYRYAHQDPSVASMGVLGLSLVFLANAPHSFVHMLAPDVMTTTTTTATTIDFSLASWVSSSLHAIHGPGPTHSMVNVLGCGLLLGSNYLSRQSGKCIHGHDHGHGHHHHRRYSHNDITGNGHPPQSASCGHIHHRHHHNTKDAVHNDDHKCT
eukprot:scaffold1221_cov207-Amphora_coffeaeformis.AAC.41